MESLRRRLRKTFNRPFRSADDLWRKCSRWGEINEFFGRLIYASDDWGYNPPFITNPFREREEEQKWVGEKTDWYDYTTPERREWADKAFDFAYSMLEGRIKKDDVILDVGASSGYQLENFHKKGHTNLWAIDPMKAAIERGRQLRPYINFVEAFFGPKESDIKCDLLVCFGSIMRIPYGHDIFDAIDRCTSKYVFMWLQDALDDFHRDSHVGLAKRGFICIEKRVVTEDGYLPIGREGGDGPMIELGNRRRGTEFATKRNFRCFYLFRRIEPREPAPKSQKTES